MSAAAALLFAACEKVEAPDPGKPDDGGEGNEPAEETGFIPGTILAQYNETSVTLRQGTDESETLSYYFETDDEVTEERTVTLKVDETLVGDSRLLPEANYEFTETFTVPAGSYESATQTITFKADGLEEGEYVLPIAEVVPEGETASEPLVYNITVRVPAQNKYKLDDSYQAVLYIDTDLYDPRLITDYATSNTYDMNSEPFLIGWIANLRRASLKYENGRAMLSLGTKLTEVLGSYDTYVLPLQDQGTKVCIAIEGGGTGLGFCNLTETQMDDFVSQVADLVRTYDLDGVNLWDQNAGYENAAAAGLPEMNTTSYPLLIQKMREALGADKLLTVVDYGEPTEYFYDTEATGGIEVGSIVDYAWSGYTPVQDGGSEVMDPWHLDGEGVSTVDTRQPIAGITPANYGCVAVSTDKMPDPWSGTGAWVEAGLCQSKIAVLYDTTPRIQNGVNGGYESLTGGATLFDELSILYFGGTSGYGTLAGPFTYDLQWIYVQMPEVSDITDENGVYKIMRGYGKWKWGWDNDGQIANFLTSYPGSYVIYD